MKLKKEMLTHSLDDTQIMVSTDKSIFSGIVRSNPTAAFIIDMLKEDTTPEKIKAAVCERYEDAQLDVVSKDVDALIEKFRSINIIED
jgi:hypothetical protein